MKVRKLTVGLVAAMAIALALSSAQPARALSFPAHPDPLMAQVGNDHRAVVVSGSGPVVTQSGPVQGFLFAGDEKPNINEEVFLGIPYAAPPVGDLRWMPPQPPANFTGIFQAKNFGGFCTQPGGVGSEDCLTLNVFRPIRKRNRPNSGLPVMVWIHGGGLVSGGSFLYDPSPLVLSGDVIVVTINYRLGFLGFFAQSAIDGEGHENGNYGFMDQQAALKWVQNNIAAFGGDPNRVTIFGESAGGQSVYANLASPTAAGLFGGAIAESGAYVEFQDYFNFIVPLATGETTGTALVQSGEAVANAVGCTSQTAACLRGVAASALVAQEPGTIFPFVDGTLLTQTIASAFTSGEFNQVPVITGGNHDEWRAFIPDITAAEYPGAVASLVGPLLDSAFGMFLVNDLYPLSAFAQPPLALGALGTDFVFACPERNSVRLLSNFVTTHAYEFNDENAPDLFGQVAAGFPGGAYHGSEIQYLFDLDQRFAHFNPFTPDQQALSKAMIKYWTTFATTGDPNSAWGGGPPTWAPYSSTTDQFQSLVPPTPAAESTYNADHNCSTFWNTF